MKIFIAYEFTDWNEYIRQERTSLYKANYIKQCEKQIVALLCREKYKGKYPVTITFRPHFKNKKRDLDNFRIKGLLDGLVNAGVIKNDNLTCINKIIVEAVFAESKGVEIDIKESKEDGTA